MSKRKIVIITILISIFIIAILLFIGLRNINNEDEVEEIEISNDTETTQQNNNNNNTSDNTSNSNTLNEEELEPMTQEEIDEYSLYMNLTANRSLFASPSYEFKSDDFETIPKDSNWFDNTLRVISGDSDLYKEVSNVVVYNLKDTKTNFIILDVYDTTHIFQMYKTESTKELVYEEFDTRKNTEEYIKLIEKKGNKIFSKTDPSSIDIGGW